MLGVSDFMDHGLSDDGTEIDMPAIARTPRFSTEGTATDGRTSGTRGEPGVWTRRKSNGLP